MNKGLFFIPIAFALIASAGYAKDRIVEMPEPVAEALVGNAMMDEAVALQNVEKEMERAQAHAALDVVLKNKDVIAPLVQAQLASA